MLVKNIDLYRCKSTDHWNTKRSFFQPSDWKMVIFLFCFVYCMFLYFSFKAWMLFLYLSPHFHNNNKNLKWNRYICMNQFFPPEHIIKRPYYLKLKTVTSAPTMPCLNLVMSVCGGILGNSLLVIFVVFDHCILVSALRFTS